MRYLQDWLDRVSGHHRAPQQPPETSTAAIGARRSSALSTKYAENAGAADDRIRRLSRAGPVSASATIGLVGSGRLAGSFGSGPASLEIGENQGAPDVR
jgi:hypothetical protein